MNSRLGHNTGRGMTPERWRQVTGLFHAAVARDAAERDAYLAAQCGDDGALKQEVEEMLAAHAQAGSLELLSAGARSSALHAAVPASAVTLPTPLAVGQRVGPYEIVAFLAEGGMGAVYRARDTQLHRDVAVKVLRTAHADDPSHLARFGREARVLATLNHPHIAQVYGFEVIPPAGDGQDPAIATRAIVMEYVEGETLADRLARGALPLHEALPLARQIADALEAAHEHRVIHRDLKPANLKIRGDGTVKVLDFGLAKSVDVRGADAADLVGRLASEVTAPGMILGTIAYMAPEQARGKPADRRVDLWAFGCLLYEMLTGRHPFAGNTPQDMLVKIFEHEPDWSALPEKTPSGMRSLLRRCLEKDPKQRLDSAAVARLELDEASRSLVTDASGQAPSIAAHQAEARVDSKRARALRGAVPVGVGLFAGALFVWALGRGPVSSPSADSSDGPRDPAQPITFIIRPPSDVPSNLASMLPYPALSPDGQRLAFVAGIRPQSLRIQRIGDLDATAVAAIEGDVAPTPFWSPDGRAVAFVSGTQLKRLTLGGDRVDHVVASDATGFGGAWTRRGQIIFGRLDGLHRVAADGGEPARVTHVDESRGERSHRFPTMLPDSSSLFVYAIVSDKDDTRGLYLGSLDDAAVKRRLLPDDSNVAFGSGPDGQVRLFFVRAVTLLAQRFDVSSQRLIGEPVVVAHSIRQGESGRLAPFTVAGRTLAYRPNASLDTRLVWIDRQGERRATIATADPVRYPSISPDGERLAISQLSAGENATWDIWVFDLQRGTSERLTHDPVGVGQSTWLDNRRIIYASAGERDSNLKRDWNLYLQPATGSLSAERLDGVPTDAPIFPSSVAPNGQFFLLSGINGIWQLPLADVRQAERLLPRGAHGRVSPDGRWLAYTSVEGTERQVYITTYPNPTERWRVSTTSGEDPQWRRDGRELYYIEASDTLRAVSVDTGSRFKMGNSRPLFRAAFAQSSRQSGPAYAPSRDGQRFLVVESPDRQDEQGLHVTVNWTVE